jgi:3-mercaptopyruvate sulfurtransferase SseA
MKRPGRILFVWLVALFLVSACNAQATGAPPTLAPTTLVEPAVTLESDLLPATDADVPRVSIEEARAALESGAAVLVDVRSPEAFASRHITGSISVPLGQIEMDLASVPLEKEQWIITYCA